MDAELLVVGGVDDGCSQWTAEGELVIHEQPPPRRHDHADRVRERLGLAARPIEFVEELGEGDIDRFGHELCLAAGEEAPERAAGPAGVSDDLAEPDAVDAALAHERCRALHHAPASR